MGPAPPVLVVMCGSVSTWHMGTASPALGYAGRRAIFVQGRVEMPGKQQVQIAELPFRDLNDGTDRSEVTRVTQGGGAHDDAKVVAGWLSTFDPGDSAHTLTLYRRVSKRFLEWLEQRSLTLRNLSGHDLGRFRDEMAGAASTRANRLAIVKSLLTHAHSVGYTRANVGRAVRGPRVALDPDARALTESDVAQLVRTAEAMLHAERNRPNPRPRFVRAAATRLYLVRFLYVSGARVSEVVAVRWGDLRPRADGDVQLSIIGKGRKRRTLPLPQRFVRELQREYGPAEPARTDRIFPFGPRRAQTVIAELTERIGFGPGVSAHCLRHACATHALHRGAPVHVIQRALGHSSLATTGKYAHALGDGASRYLPDL